MDNLVLWLYLVDFISSMKILLMVMACVASFLGFWTLLDDFAFESERTRRKLFLMAVCLMVAATFLPTAKTMRTILGVHIAKELIDSPVGNKVIKRIEQMLDDK